MTDPSYFFGHQLPGRLVLNDDPSFFRDISFPGNPLLRRHSVASAIEVPLDMGRSTIRAQRWGLLLNEWS